MTDSLAKAKRCPAAFNGGECASAVFYDWGLQIIDAAGYLGPDGAPIARYEGHGDPRGIKICARCTTPYLLIAGDLISIADELGGEDVKAILQRGQSTLPHVKIKDP